MSIKIEFGKYILAMYIWPDHQQIDYRPADSMPSWYSTHMVVASNNNILLLLFTGEPQTFQVSVTPTSNYPLDIYILMDLSFSMSAYLNNLRSVSLQLGMSRQLDQITVQG